MTRDEIPSRRQDPASTDDERDPASRNRDRAPNENPYLRWALVDGNRWTIIAGFSAAVFVTFLALGLAGVIGVGQSSLVTGIFTSSITGVFTLVSITITINQLVLSRILGSPGMIHNRIESVNDFRTTVQEMVDRVSVSPTEPAAFMEVVTHALSDRVHRLHEVYGEDHEPDQRRRVERLVARLDLVSTEIDNRLDENSGLLDVLSTVLNNQFSKQLNVVRRVQVQSDDLSREETVALQELADVLEEINRTRHYFKTLYLHEELASLSRMMLLSGPPAIVASFVAILLYDGLASTVGEPVLLVVVSAAMVVVLLPLMILLSFSLRFITIARRTTTFGTFTPPEELP